MSQAPTQKPRRRKMNTLTLVMGLVLGILFGILLSFGARDFLPSFGPFLIKFLVATFLFLSLVFMLINSFQDRLVGKLFGTREDFVEVRDETRKVSSALTTEWIHKYLKNYSPTVQDRARKLGPRFVNYLLWGFARNWFFRQLITLFIAIGGLITTILLFNQNELLNVQNDLLKHQNDRIETQIHLDEASRRSSLVFLMSSIMDRVNDEVAETGDSISPGLVGRVAALSRSLKPYRYFDGDTLIPRPVSTERGQLLLSIINNPIKPSITRQLFRRSTFRGAELTEANMEEAYLEGVRMPAADLRVANLRETNLKQADLTGADLQESILSFAQLQKADLTGANLWGAFMEKAHLDFARLRRATLWDIILWESSLVFADLREADLSDGDLTGSNLHGADLEMAIMTNVHLGSSDMSDTNLSEADMRGALLQNTIFTNATVLGADWRKAELNGANLAGIILDSVKYHLPNFPEELEIKGREEFDETYRFSTEFWKDEAGEPYYLILAR